MVARPPAPGSELAPAWAVAALGPECVDAVRLPWGFTNETWTATAPDGIRYIATRMASLQVAAAVIGRGPEIARRLGGAGVRTPVPIAARSNVAAGVVVSERLDGAPAMLRLGDPAGAAVVGRALGWVWRRLAAVDIDGLALDDTWARPGELAEAAATWLDLIRHDLGQSVSAGFERQIGGVERLLRARSPRFVHGDLVPVNVLLREDGQPALLDLEAVRAADPLLDAAWFRWIVGYHHPDAEEPAWSAFLDETGLDAGDPTIAALLDVLPVVRILEILAQPGLGSRARGRWLDQLIAIGGRAPR